jgi:hypothetical protein
MLTPEAAFNSHLFHDQKVEEDQAGQILKYIAGLLQIHPKTIACRGSVSKLVGRDQKKATVDEHQIWSFLPGHGVGV